MKVEEKSERRMVVSLDQTLYTEALIYKCVYWFTDNFDVSISRSGESTLIVEIAAKKDPISTDEMLSLESRLKRDLIDFKTREIIQRETQTIRELIIAKAFSPLEDLDLIDPTDVESSDEFNIAEYINRSG
jgi:His-Xaa-Ser system protein HxsD